MIVIISCNSHGRGISVAESKEGAVMKTIEMIEFLSSIKYGDRALTELRQEHDRKLDEICLYLNSQVKRPTREVLDPDCPSGVCDRDKV